jgi:hypothetical protein
MESECMKFTQIFNVLILIRMSITTTKDIITEFPREMEFYYISVEKY